MISVSVVSHGHGNMVVALLGQLLACPEVAQVIITRNLPERTDFPADERLLLLDNPRPLGFAANHNAAFQHCTAPYFCVLNPDIELLGNPFPGLLKALQATQAALAAPLVLSSEGLTEDYARRFPTIAQLAAKLLAGGDGGRYAIQPGGPDLMPEWVAGMFMLFRAERYAALSGFDEGFRLYYEDVDLCVRAWRAGFGVLTTPSVQVIHRAQRASRRKLQYLAWHLGSMARYFIKHWGRLPVQSPERGLR